MNRSFLRYILPVAGYMAVVLAFSIAPSGDDPPGPWWEDKLEHLAAYAVMGVLLARLVKGYGKNRWVLAATLLATLFGLSMEAAQAFTSSREAGLGDAAANAVGALAGAASYSAVSAWQPWKGFRAEDSRKGG